MRTFLPIVLIFCPLFLWGQGTPPMPPDQRQPVESVQQGTPPVSQPDAMQQMKKLVEKSVNEALSGKNYLALNQWQPLTPQQKLRIFVMHTYSLRTFANAGVDAVADKIEGGDPHYERGAAGLAQHYGIELATNETDVFFERFFIPVLLKQDPRYFRNPELPFFRRALYSMSRVVITRSDSGHSVFNASAVLGGAASQALSDLYIPGHDQGLGPIRDRVTFDLLRDAGFNLLHEFWPDIRRKLFPHHH